MSSISALVRNDRLVRLERLRDVMSAGVPLQTRNCIHHPLRGRMYLSRWSWQSLAVHRRLSNSVLRRWCTSGWRLPYRPGNLWVRLGWCHLDWSRPWDGWMSELVILLFRSFGRYYPPSSAFYLGCEPAVSRHRSTWPLSDRYLAFWWLEHTLG